MQRMKWFGMGMGLAMGALLALAGCAEKSPLEKMMENRARYSARLNGFYVQAQPLVAEVVADAETEAGEETAAVEEAPVEIVQNAHLDILVQHDSSVKLPGITLDITQVDVAKSQKGHWRMWVDTSRVEKANPTQYSYVIEGVDYVEGDGFNVEVRHLVPEAERGEYQEFANVGS